MLGSGRVRDGERFVEISEYDFSKFISATDQDQWKAIERLASHPWLSGVGPKYLFEELEKAVGFSHNPCNPLADARLRGIILPSCTRSDVMHVFYSNGIAEHETHLILERAKEVHDFCFADLRNFLKGRWTWPKLRKDNACRLPQVFTTRGDGGRRGGAGPAARA